MCFIFSIPFVEDIFFSPWVLLAPLFKYLLTICGINSGFSILFHLSVCLFLCYYYMVLITIALKSGSRVWSQEVCCLQICSFSGMLWLFGVFCGFTQILGLFFSIAINALEFWQEYHWSYIAFGTMDIFTIFFFSNTGTWGVFSISDIVFIEHILTSLVKFIRRCFLIFYVIPNRIVSFICLSTFHYWNCNWFLYVDFYILKIRWIHCLDPTGLWLSIWNSLYTKSNNLQIMTSMLLPFQFECLLFLCCAN